MRAQRYRRGQRGRLRASSALLLGVALALPASAPAAVEPKPFGHSCKVEAGVRFCPTVELSERVPSFDGVPLDVDVTLPEQGVGPFPAIVMIQGWGGSKPQFEATSTGGESSVEPNYDNVFYAQHGFAVLNYSARGWKRSCGSGESRAATPACADGFVRLADQRYEARDAQYLLGLLGHAGG